jgi:hypothetical protein
MKRLACCLLLALAGGCFQQTVQPAPPPPMPAPPPPVRAEEVNAANAEQACQRLQDELDREEQGTGRSGQPGPR